MSQKKIKLEVYCDNGKVGGRTAKVVEFEAEDLLDDDGKINEEVAEELARDELWNMISWGWRVVP